MKIQQIEIVILQRKVLTIEFKVAIETLPYSLYETI